MNEQDIDSWKGRTFVAEEVLSERLIATYRATLAPYLAEVGDGEAPLASHWCLFPTEAPMAELGDDGHPKTYPHLPPPPLPRRMWAGGSLEFVSPLRIGDKVRRTTTLSDIQHKQGRSGELWFMAVDHVYDTDRGVAIRERQDIVYRAPVEPKAKPAAGQKAKTGAEPDRLPVLWQVETPPTLLVRYCSLLFNSHRIHFDLPYATEVEGYEGLVVHGPLQASLLLNGVATTLGHTPTRFSYRGQLPAIGGRRLDVCVAPQDAGSFHTRSAGGIHMSGQAEG
ncbi:FAS1-like dehydratase domain-containing protein [Pseudohoeflea coraliihabitans]|uniref:MaoC family dehydratase N-terminal domain-containing protein n=1 Tax=Pseudohoeflea coraliihabitans TaxID=2860393 RepID=A0ABS6WSZ8_9HYPH|nr:MaoC family dehydratase N-terminal domain-containing protein [Pseudohoeflea sp. DP4N28-3]MBW3098190.1 MaoC family dehydratase N-terminal domain-containing protein [Pseudohoeflea sp. DP4N28-3]